MPIPSTIADLSTTAASNSPAGSDPPTEGDNYLRAISAILKQTYVDLGTAGTAAVGAGLIGYNTAATYATATVGYELARFTDVFDALYTRTASEISGGITPTNYGYPPGNVKRYGAVGDGSANDTTAIQNAYTALGSGGIIYFPRGTYNFTALTFDGLLNITFRGEAGGEVGNTTPGDFAGATVLRHTGSTGLGISFSGSGYNSKQITFEDIAVYSASDNYALKFDNCSQVNFERVMIVSNGSNANSGGIYFSRCYYVHAHRLFVLKSANQRISTCKGIRIDMGAAASFLGGQYNFNSSSIQSFQTGLSVGALVASGANENYATINLIESELLANQVGFDFEQGVKSALVMGCYIEANTDKGGFVALKARNVTVKNCYFNNSTASDADLRFGASGGYQEFYNCAVENCTFASVLEFGVLVSAIAGSSLVVTNCHFTAMDAGSVGISSNLAVVAVEDCLFSGFTTAQRVTGEFHRVIQSDGFIHDVPKAITLSSVDYSIVAADPGVLTLTNTRAGAKLLAPVATAAKGWRGLIVNSASSTQSVLVRNSGDSATLATLTAGAKAMLWNDGTSDYAGLLT